MFNYYKAATTIFKQHKC